MNAPESQRRTLIQAGMIADGGRVLALPGAILLDGHRILAAGPPESIGSCAAARIVDAQNALVIPALVNAHAHLDLTHMGPRQFGGDFPNWAGMVRAGRCSNDQAIEDSVRRGVALSVAGGTALIGDIGGNASLVPMDTLRKAGLRGVSFVELFGIGTSFSEAKRRIHSLIDGVALEDQGVRLGLQPHAPYSSSVAMYEAAAETGLPMATHLAETLEEIQFIRDGDGPLAEMLVRFTGDLGERHHAPGLHPIELLLQVLSRTPCIAVHLNYVDDEHIEMLSAWPLTVAYCPRASAYFGHPQHGQMPHRYRDMIQAGINVALGTDSIICLDTPDRISVLDDMRLLWRRDGADFHTLLRMATNNGATALGADEQAYTLGPGRCAGLLAIDRVASGAADSTQIISRAMNSDAPPRWLIEPDR